MIDEILQKNLQRANGPLLANALELGAQAIQGVAGNAITNTVNGQPLTSTFLHSALAARLQALLINNVNGS